MEYNKLSDEIIAKLQALVGVQNVVTDAGQMEIYAHDEVTDPAYHHMPEAVVLRKMHSRWRLWSSWRMNITSRLCPAAQAQVLPAVQCPFTAV